MRATSIQLYRRTSYGEDAYCGCFSVACPDGHPRIPDLDEVGCGRFLNEDGVAHRAFFFADEIEAMLDTAEARRAATRRLTKAGRTSAAEELRRCGNPDKLSPRVAVDGRPSGRPFLSLSLPWGFVPAATHQATSDDLPVEPLRDDEQSFVRLVFGYGRGDYREAQIEGLREHVDEVGAPLRVGHGSWVTGFEFQTVHEQPPAGDAHFVPPVGAATDARSARASLSTST